jgi:hypothetical protein
MKMELWDSYARTNPFSAHSDINFVEFRVYILLGKNTSAVFALLANDVTDSALYFISFIHAHHLFPRIHQKKILIIQKICILIVLS